MTATWAAPWVLVGAQVLAAGLAGVLALVAGEPTGRLLAALAGLLLLATGLRDAVARPVLSADASGLDVVEGLRRRRVAWREVAAVRVEHGRRRGAGSRWLEIDLDDHLVLLPGRRLGADVAGVAEELIRLREQRAGGPAPG